MRTRSSLTTRWGKGQVLVALACATAVTAPVAVSAQESATAARLLSVEEGWRFMTKDVSAARQLAYDDQTWPHTRIPHNGQGLTDDGVFSRAARPLWLRNTVDLPALAPGDRVLLQVTRTGGIECWLNGEDAGRTASDEWTFLKDVTPLVRPGRNVIALRTMLPGIQGYVRLHVLPPIHLEPRGLRIDMPQWTGGPASVRVRTQVENHSDSPRTVRLRATVFDPAGRQLVELDSTPLFVPAGAAVPVTLSSAPISHPPLWSPETPQLCKTKVELLEDQQPVHQQTADFGFRWHRFEPEGPFTLNGKRYPIRGVVYVEPAERRFPDRESLWNYEIDLLKGMGVNFVRTSRSIDQSFFEACDRAGLMVTAPIHYLAPEKTRAGDVENLLHEAYNHPSLIAWNINGEGKDAASAKALSLTTQQVRAGDSTRSVLCCELGWRSPGTVGLVDADVAGQGNYTGWYEGTLEHIGPYMDDYRDLLRERYGRALPILVSNFGAAGVATLHTDAPRRNDYSHEYHTAFNERFYTEIENRPWLSGGFIFCWRDLNSEQPIPRHTWKGMLDLNDRKKDAYFFYQSRWTEKPMVHIAQQSWTSREAWPSGGELPIIVYSNGEQVELFHDGRSLGIRKEKDNRFEWSVRFQAGQNEFRAVARQGSIQVEDSYGVAIQFRPPAVETRLFSRGSAPVKLERVLAWNDVPGVDDYTVWSGPEADFAISQGVLVTTTRSSSVTLGPTEGHPFYKVVASFQGVAGPASTAVGLRLGSLRWKFTNDGWLLSSPAIADLNGDGTVEFVIGSYDGKVYAVRADGTELWSFDLVDPVIASPAVAALRRGEAPSLVVNSTKALYVLSNDGALKWRRDGIRQFDRSVRSPTLADLDGDGTLEIIVGTDTGKLLVFDADGRLRWEYSTAGPQNRGLNPTTCLVVDRPEGAGKALCFAADNGILYFLDADGKELWKRDLKTADSSVGLPPNHLTPAAGLMDDARRVTIIAGGASLEAVAATGDVIWQRNDLTGFPQISNLFGDGNRQVVVSAWRTLHVLDRNGQDIWKHTLPHPRDYFLQPPASADLDEDGEPDLVMGTRATNLLAMSSRGKLLWSFKCEDELTGTPAVADIDQDGIVDVVFGGRDGSLYVVSAGKAPPYAQETRAYRWDNARTGAYTPPTASISRRLESPRMDRYFTDVPYGSDALQKMDVYLPTGMRPTGVLIELHGGGWRRGHKGHLELYSGLIEKVLESGIAVVSANYRLTPRSIWPAQVEDAARVIQFVRSKASEWNLDPERVALIGGSAGAHLSLWVGLHDDLADPQSDDPVQRQSTRVSGIVDCWAPTDLTRAELVGRAREAIPQLLGTTPEEWGTPRFAALLREASPISFVSADDPPVLIVHTEPLKELPAEPDWKTPDVHSILYGQLLEQRIKSVGGQAELISQPAGSAASAWVERALAFVSDVMK